LLIGLSLQKCGFNHEKPKNVQSVKLWDSHTRFLQESTWEPIRIYVDYTTLDKQAATGVISATFATNIRNVMAQTVSTYQSLLKVKRSSSPIAISECVPQVTVSDEVKAGVSADLILFVYIENYDADSESSNGGTTETEATAAYCAEDPDTKRPLAGILDSQKI
jgi:hypothetical protein